MDVTEYCDNRSLDACDMEIGRGAEVIFCCGEVVTIGGKGGWTGFDVGEEIAGGEVAGDDVLNIVVDIAADRIQIRAIKTIARQGREQWFLNLARAWVSAVRSQSTQHKCLQLLFCN